MLSTEKGGVGNMSSYAGESIVIGNVRLTFEHRTYQGAVIRVFVVEKGHERQALKFDPFVRGAHFHVNPDGRNVVRPIRDSDPLGWTIKEISERLLDLLTEAGYGQSLVGLVQRDVMQAVPRMEAALARVMPG
jgi:hypothetical protein